MIDLLGKIPTSFTSGQLYYKYQHINLNQYEVLTSLDLISILKKLKKTSDYT